MLGSTLFGNDRLAFRDVSHFYTPLYGYVGDRTSAEWLPLWNDRCQTGMPLVGETSTAVLYPVRYLVFSLPTSVERQMAWYVAFHLILASILARFCAGRAGAGRFGRMIAGLSYPLSGSVLFLYCNPPFLVSAAWLPLALSMLVQPGCDCRLKRIVLSAIALAMMILGGDPQTALHVALVAVVILGLRGLKQRKISVDFLVLAASLLLTIGLTAPQIAASISWSQHSDRVGGQVADAFQYSVPPWHFAELLTANGSGSLFPINRRISSLIPGDGRMWTMTLFMGMLPALMLLDRITRWRRSSEDIWLIIAFAGAACAMGHFGIVWWIQWLTTALPSAESSVGGAYWLLYQILPGYDAFRYPAKWLPFFALGISIASGIWGDRVTSWRAHRAWVLAMAIVLAALITLWLIPIDSSWKITDEFWGPLDVAGARAEISVSLLVSVLSLGMLGCSALKWNLTSPHRFVCFATMILASELIFSATQQIAKIDIADERALMLADWGVPTAHSLRLLRVQTEPGSTWPKTWKQEPDPNRLLEVESLGRSRMFGRWHLESPHGVVNNFVSISSKHFQTFWSIIRETQKEDGQIDWKAIEQWLALDGVIEANANQQFKLFEPHRFKIELFDRWRNLSPIEVSDTDIRDRFRAIAKGVGDVPTFVSDSKPLGDSVFSGESALQSPESSVISEAAQEMLLTLRCSEPVLVVRPVFQDGHWIAEIKCQGSTQETWTKIPVGQVDFLKQGAQLHPGDWLVRFSYQPWWHPTAGWLALATWLASLSTIVIRYRDRDHFRIGASQSSSL